MLNLVRKVLWRQTPKNDIEILERPSTLRSESVRRALARGMLGLLLTDAGGLNCDYNQAGFIARQDC
jgi:hypothetical protein